MGLSLSLFHTLDSSTLPPTLPLLYPCILSVHHLPHSCLLYSSSYSATTLSLPPLSPPSSTLLTPLLLLLLCHYSILASSQSTIFHTLDSSPHPPPPRMFCIGAYFALRFPIIAVPPHECFPYVRIC